MNFPVQLHWTWPLTQKGTRGIALPFQAWIDWHYCVLLPKAKA